MPRTDASTPSKRDELDQRAERILDAGGELLVAWGYRRVTIDEIARRAGVGKGTVYLHFHTKEALFLTVLMRSQATLAERTMRSLREDPVNILPSRMARTGYLAVSDDPIVGAILTGDTDVLGALTRSAPEIAGGMLQTREETLTRYLDTLRDHGIVRADIPVATQLHAFRAIVTGYLMLDAWQPRDVPDTESTAEMVAETVRATLETPRAAQELARAAPRVIGLYQNLLDRLHEEIQRQKLT